MNQDKPDHINNGNKAMINSSTKTSLVPFILTLGDNIYTIFNHSVNIYWTSMWYQKLIFFVLVTYLYVEEIASQAIPYSYASGRDVGAVEARFQRFQAAKAQNAGSDVLMGICGSVDVSQQQCFTKVGRPKDSESLACDSLCCLTGYKVGNCGSDYGVKLDWAKLLASLTAGAATGGAALPGAIGSVNVQVAANCFCSNDPSDVKCGRDGSFKGIRCPFDSSACWRKCCREGKNDGKCKGFMKTKCKCS